MAMRNLKLGDRNRIISEFYLSHLNHDKLFTIRHFVDNFGLAKTTVFRAIQRADRIRRGGRRGRQETLDRRPGSGRPHSQTREGSPARSGEQEGGQHHAASPSIQRLPNLDSQHSTSARSKGAKAAKGAGN